MTPIRIRRLLLALGLYLLISKTRLGMKIRAGAFNHEMTEALDQRYVSETGDSIREECRRLLAGSPLPER